MLGLMIYAIIFGKRWSYGYSFGKFKKICLWC
jgi:hypothetical protein